MNTDEILNKMSEDDKNDKPSFRFFFHDKICILLNEEGIFFNRDEFKNFAPDDFAKAFIEILENNLNVKFTIKEKTI